MATTGQPLRGLSAAEIAAACAELQSLAGAEVVDVVRAVRTTTDDDLVLVLAPGASTGKQFVHVVVTGPTARLCLTTRRWPKGALRSAPHLPLAGARFLTAEPIAGERIAVLHFATPDGERRLVAELFGTRGLVVLTDADRRVLHTSRPVQTATRRLLEGDHYTPPPRDGAPRPSAHAVRFAPPVLAAIDAHFTRADLLAAANERSERLSLRARRAVVRARAKVDGIAGQLADVGRAAGLRDTANLMLAYQHGVPRGAPSMTVPHPERQDEPIVIQLDPARPVVVQAQALYEKARRLDDSRAVNEARLLRAQHELAGAEQALADAEAIAAQLAALAGDATDLHERLAALPFPPEPPSPGEAQRGQNRPCFAVPHGENVRRFVSAEGYPIWVGRNNEQNDRLTMRLANGNDLWLHVGGGRAGSHVIVRLPKQKTASLETLLDAGTLAVHFSKARGESRIDVVYTQKKHVRKPKGLPAGAVVPAHTKTITVIADQSRLQRLLASASTEEGDGDDVRP